MLETLLWPDEVRNPAFAFLDDDIEVRSQELKMAASLIDSMTVDFDPEEYHDGYREALQELVSAKAEGRDVVQPEEAETPEGEPTSLADALKASLTAAQQDQRQPGGGTGSSGSGRSAGSRSSASSKSGTAKAGPARASTTKSRTKTAAAKPDGDKPARKPAAKPAPSRSRRRAS